MKSFVAFALLIVGVSASTIRLHERRILKQEPLLVRAVESYEHEPVLVTKQRKHIPILSLTNEIRGSQSNDLQFQTANGISVTEHTQSLPGVRSIYEDESGQLVESDSSIVKTGSYSYTSPEGIPITVNWRADENGFHAEGDHLPKNVQMPAEHAEIHRQALARAGLVVPVAPLFTINDEVALRRIKGQPMPAHPKVVKLVRSNSNSY